MHAGNPPFKNRLHRAEAPARPCSLRAVTVATLWVLLAMPTAFLGAQESTPIVLPDLATEPLITGIEIRSNDPVSADTRSLIDIPIGEPFDPAAVRRALAALHSTGQFAHIDWWLQPVDSPSATVPGILPGAVRGILVLHPHPRARSVILEGEPGLKPKLLRRRIRQESGALIDHERIAESVTALRRLYLEKGYFEAEVSHELRPGPLNSQDLVFRLRSGPRARIGSLRLEADESIEADREEGEALPPVLRTQLLDLLRTDSGSYYKPEVLRQDAERLRQALVERGHYQADVKTPRETYRPDEQTVDVAFPVRLGPIFQLSLNGVTRRYLRRRGLLPFLDGRPFNSTLWDQTCARLRESYQRQGHYRAEVECADQTTDDHQRRLTLSLTPGDTFTVESVELSGAERFDPAGLRPLLTTGPNRWWAPGAGRLVDADLAADLERMRSFYQLEGFSEVSLGPAEIRAQDDLLKVEIPIVEGPRRRVVSVDIHGDIGILPPDLHSRLPLQPGGGFHPLLVDDTLNLIRTLYEEEGYPDADVVAELDWNDEGTLVDLEMAITPGPRRVLDHLVLRGLQHTRPETVKRFSGLRRGEPLSRRRLLRAERDLYRLGIFSEVEVDLAPSAALTPERSVRIRLREGRRWRLAYGLSYHSDDGIGGLFGLGLGNIRGRGERLQLDIRASQNDQRLRLIYDQPSFGRLRLPVTYTLFGRHEIRESYEVEESGARVSIFRDLERVRLGLVYDYRFVELEEDAGDPTLVERQDNEVEISSLAPNLFIDRRDDPLNPTVGWSSAVQLEYAFRLFGANTELAKAFWQQTQYLKLGRWGTLAGSFRLGLIEPLSTPDEADPIVPESLASSRVPISERFFAGGRTTHRAYERDSLGTLDQTLIATDDGRLLEAGGNGLVLLNLDYRFPISGPVEGVTFFDLGNTWADWRNIDLSDLRPGAGLGVRYASPVGPIRAEIGWKLDPRPFEDSGPVFLLSFGNPF